MTRSYWKRLGRGDYETRDGLLYVSRTRYGWAYGTIEDGERVEVADVTRPLERTKRLAERLLPDCTCGDGFDPTCPLHGVAPEDVDVEPQGSTRRRYFVDASGWGHVSRRYVEAASLEEARERFLESVGFSIRVEERS